MLNSSAIQSDYRSAHTAEIDVSQQIQGVAQSVNSTSASFVVQQGVRRQMANRLALPLPQQQKPAPSSQPASWVAGELDEAAFVFDFSKL
jgi:hypothetical protein